MDELTLLRELDDDVPDPAAHVERAARARLAAEIRRAAPRRRHRRAMTAAMAAAALAMTVGAVLIARDAARDAPPSEPSVRFVTAKQVLHRAARRSTAANAMPIPRDDQYMYTKTILEETDGQGPPKVFVDENWHSVDGSRPSRVSERGKTWIAPPLRPNESYWPPTSYAELEKLPTEPRALLRAIAPTDPSRPLSAEQLEFRYMGLMFLLGGSRVMPPRLQAAAFNALASFPGVEIVDDDVDARGRHGYGIRWPEHPVGRTLIVDRKTYDYLGMRQDNQTTSLVASGVVDRIGERPTDAAGARRPS